jgi:hypothetical protein
MIPKSFAVHPGARFITLCDRCPDVRAMMAYIRVTLQMSSRRTKSESLAES